MFNTRTNILERLNQEVRRRGKGDPRIFPNTESAMRLLGALLMEQDEVWSTGRLYFKMERYREWKETNAGQNKGKEKKGNEEKAA